MFRCKVIDFLFKSVPLKIWQDFLIRYHIEKCPACQEKFASVEEANLFLIQESEAGELEGLWPAIRERLTERGLKDRGLYRPRLRWAWAAAAAGMVAALILGFWLYSIFKPGKAPEEESLVERFQIKYIRVENKPAHAYVFWPQGSEMVIVWAEKNM